MIFCLKGQDQFTQDEVTELVELIRAREVAPTPAAIATEQQMIPQSSWASICGDDGDDDWGCLASTGFAEFVDTAAKVSRSHALSQHLDVAVGMDGPSVWM